MIDIKNPWLKLNPSQDSYVLEMDQESVRRFNASVRDKATKVIEESIPEPFIGNPDSARVVLLNLNPGHSDDDYEWQRRDAFRDVMFRNLRHISQPYPFYPFNPAFEGNGAVKWWLPLTAQLKEESRLDLESFSERLLVIEWFPYHSQKASLPQKRVCPSQEYSFQLAKHLIARKGVVAVGMRSKRHWLKADQSFADVPFLKNPQRPWITRHNMDEGLFDRLLGALQSY